MILCRIGVVTYKETEKNDKDVINYSIFTWFAEKLSSIGSGILPSTRVIE